MQVEKKLLEELAEPSVLNCCALVVLYYPDVEFIENLYKIKKQFPLVILVSNTPGGEDVLDIKNIKLINNNENLGIAKALNQGLQIALELDYEWIVTFDQDTIIFPYYFEVMSSLAKKYSCKPFVLGCNYIITEAGDPAHRFIKNNIYTIEKKTLITSGTLIPARFSSAIGGFREDYFIDSVDHEFCLRASKNGAKILLIKEPLMRHIIGREPAKLFGCILSFKHPPFRRYYISRNTILTIKRNIRSHPLWCLKQVFRLFFEFFSILILEGSKLSKLLAFFKGLIEGVKSK